MGYNTAMKTIGLPRMIAPRGFKRDFSPNFVSWLSNVTRGQILVEKGLGSDLGYNCDQDLDIQGLETLPRKDIFTNSDVILSITSPQDLDIEFMRPDSRLIAMLHLDTHPTRKALLQQKHIQTVSLDEIKDCENKRLIQDYRRTAWNAVTEGFIQLRKLGGKKLLSIYLLGFGNLGKEAAFAALNMGELVNLVPTNHLHSKYNYHKKLFNSEFPDMIIDATKRTDYSEHILTQEDIALVPTNCVIVDIAADCYQEKDSIVKGIQGIPTGNESKYVFLPDDSAWEDINLIPKKYQLPKELRKIVVSHYAWPSCGTNSDRIANMQKYEQQLKQIHELFS